VIAASYDGRNLIPGLMKKPRFCALFRYNAPDFNLSGLNTNNWTISQPFTLYCFPVLKRAAKKPGTTKRLLIAAIVAFDESYLLAGGVNENS
jgi:hypothetical protein